MKYHEKTWKHKLLCFCVFSCACCVYLSWFPMFWLPNMYSALIRVSRFTRLFRSHHAVAKLDFLSRASLATVNAWQVAGCKARARKLRMGETGELIFRFVKNKVKHQSRWRSQSERRYKKRMKRYKLYKLALWDILSIRSRCRVRFWSSRLWRHPGRALLWQQTFEALQAKASEILSIGPKSEAKRC